MPAFPSRHVGFAHKNSVSRPPRDEELSAMYNFALHASHCTHCADPYRTFLAGATLCERGHRHARHVAKYIYNKSGHAYSTTDGDEYQSVHIEIPQGYEAVRGLLKALEHGLRLRKSRPTSYAAPTPVISYDRTYQVSSRKAERKERPRVEIVEPPRGHYQDGKVIYINRDGSLYHPPALDDELATRRAYDPRGSVYYGYQEFYA